MANFFSDSDEDKAVEELLSQAKESTVLEQVAAINCAGFSDSGLPSHLETRFQKLKSFPSSKPSSLSAKSLSLSHPSELKNGDSVSVDKAQNSGGNGGNGENKSSKCSMKIPESKNCLSPSKSSDSGSFSPFETTTRRKMEKKGTKPPSWDNFSSRSVSPPAKGGCFLCSPNRVSRKKSKENRDLDLGLDWGKQHDEILSDLSNSQRKMIKKAMEEEERICREADKIVKWAKQASARMDISGIEDELSDDENAKFP